jgi:selenocysteine lyase/cysteine desulfurase
MAGTLGAIEYLASLGNGAEGGRRARIAAAFDLIAGHENRLCARLVDGLQAIAGVTIHGIVNPNRMDARVPTVSFSCVGHDPQAIARALAADNIFVWDGHNYALELVRRLGLEERGGVVRIGLAQYNTAAEVDAAIAAVARAVG